MNAALTAEERSSIQSQKITAILAFLSVYVIWGSTYFAIRVAVATVPPFLAAGLRFTLAGTFLFAYALIRRTTLPTAVEWRNLAVSALLLFVPAYGGLFWAEKTVPSGIASALVATIPVWMALMEVFVLRQTRLRWQLVASLLCGMSGVALLTLKGVSGGSHSLLPYMVMLMSQISWSVGTLMTKNMRLPASKVLRSAAQMGLGGLMLMLLSLGAGELRPFPHISTTAWWAIIYLTIAGSIIGFTAYVWLLGHFPATTVGSYAYVNPVVALALGYWFGHESLDWRVFAGTFLVLVGVVLILRGNRATH
jgi:drug/metabolite transporter (DMT)-like permease